MKIQFKLFDVEHRIWATQENTFGQSIINQPNKSILKFVSLDHSIEVSITVDERHRLAQSLAIGMQNEVFEFDFAQPMPSNRLNQ